MEPESAPPLRDPIGLLARSPELATLARSSPALRKAIERGRPFDAYRALFWGNALGRFKGEAGATAKTLLGHRRVFFKPITSAPTMMTYNGVGTSLYGSSDRDGVDGSYVATLFVVLLFVPIFPIASYLVRDGGGSRRSWAFLAKVPMSAVTHLWQRAIGLGVLSVVGVGAAAAFEGYGHNTLHIANGLDHAVTAQFDGASVVVPASGEASMRANVGRHSLVVRDGNRELESSVVDVPRGRGTVVWNVLGAAPLYLEDVVYSASGSESPKTDAKIFCGESLVVEHGVDYAFVDPPKSIQMSEGSSSTTRKHLAIAKGGVDVCVAYMAQHGEPQKAAHVYLHVATAERATALKLGQTAEALIPTASREDAEAFTKALLARDDSVDAHRLYQDWLLSTGQRDRAVAEYDARAKAHPDDADAEYLSLRLREDADPRVAIDAAVARHPKHAYLRHMQIYAHRLPRDFEVIAAAADVLREVDMRLWARNMPEHVTSLVALGRGKDALDMLVAASRDPSLEPNDAKRAQFFAYRVAQQLGANGPGLPLDADAPEGFPLMERAACGLDLDASDIDVLHDEDVKTSLRIARAARTSPDAAVKSADAASERALAQLPTATAALLFGEAWRRGDEALEAKLSTQFGGKKTADAMTAYLRAGTLSEELRGLPIELLAALDFERSRAAGLDPKEKSACLARAKESDALHGPVTAAIGGWPP